MPSACMQGKAGSVAGKFRITRCGPMGRPARPRFFSSSCASEVAAHSSLDLVVFDLDNVLVHPLAEAPAKFNLPRVKDRLQTKGGSAIDFRLTSPVYMATLHMEITM